MSTKSTSIYAERFGNKARQIRERRGLSRLKLDRKLARKFGDEHPVVLRMTDGFLKRLEGGLVKKLDYDLVETLAQGLECSMEEHNELFLAAGLNFLDNGHEIVSLLDTELANFTTAIKQQALIAMTRLEQDKQSGHPLTSDEVRFVLGQAAIIVGEGYSSDDAL